MKATFRTWLLFASLALVQSATAKTLEIYFIDVEGGQSTLLVAPGGESLLIDTGNPGSGVEPRVPGKPGEARDANRILAAARDAGIKHIDYLLVTHFHADHMGGAIELSQLLPIRTFIDHGGITSAAEKSSSPTMALFDAYAKVRGYGRHIQPHPGDRLPLKNIEARVVVSAAATIAKPLAGAGAKNAACGEPIPAALDPNENLRSTGIVVRFGKFRFVDLGDLNGAPLLKLVCPLDLIGPVDVLLVPHHGNADAAEPATLAALQPRVAIMNNGAKKGGAPAAFQYLRAPPAPDVWQIDRSAVVGSENFAAERIANLDDSTAHWIRLSANEDGSFLVTNGRTGKSQSYPAK